MTTNNKMGVILFAFFFVGLAMHFPALIRITLGGIVLFYIGMYAIAFVGGILGGICDYLIIKPYKWLDGKCFQNNKVLRWIFSIKGFYLLIGILFAGFLVRGFFIDDPYASNSSNSNKNYENSYIGSQIVNTNDVEINTGNESGLNSDYTTGYIDESVKEEYEFSPYEGCSYIGGDGKWHKCSDDLVDDSDYDSNDSINFNPEKVDNTPIAVIPEAHIPTVTIPKSQIPKTQKSYDWDEDPEPSEFYEYDNFDDYYDNYGNYYDDYSYDELKDMYDDERGNNRLYLEYDDYYDDIWYDYYGGYDGYNIHYDDYVDEYGYED